MPRFLTDSNLYPALFGLALIGLLRGDYGISQDLPAPIEEEEFDTVEGQFFQLQDASGYFWQAAPNGALTSGETRYLQAGLNLIVDGLAFAPTEGSMVSPSEASLEAQAISLTLQESRDGLRIRRSLAFDVERGAVRVLDTLTNTSSTSASIEVDLRTTYPFAWQSLHNQTGEPLSSDPALQLGAEDQGILVHFSPVEGRHDTFILASAGKGSLQPRVKASNNRRELTLGYEIVLAPGESVSLLHWIAQAALQKVGNARELSMTLIRNGELVAPRVDRALVTSVINFPEKSFPRSQSSLGGLRQLISLNGALARLGAQRRSQSVLWIDSSTQLVGDISGEEAISINDSYLGVQSVEVSKIAAIFDRGPGGRASQVFLRDGRVMVGEIEGLGLIFQGEDSDITKSLVPGNFTALLFPVSELDGVSPETIVGNLEVINGSVLSAEKGDQLEFEFATSWGREIFSAEQVRELKFIADPIPHFRCVTTAGDRFPGFLTGTTLRLGTSEAPPVEVPVSVIARYGANGLRAETIGEEGESWIDFDEVPPSWVPEEGFLLGSGELRIGGFSDEILGWKQGGQFVEVSTDEISQLRRETSRPTLMFSLLLKSGETLTGLPANPIVNVTIGGKERPLPIEKLNAYRSPSS